MFKKIVWQNNTLYDQYIPPSTGDKIYPPFYNPITPELSD
jgi:hypothetical protein